MKILASELKAFQSQSKDEIPSWARRKELQILKQAFLIIDSDSELFIS